MRKSRVAFSIFHKREKKLCYPQGSHCIGVQGGAEAFPGIVPDDSGAVYQDIYFAAYVGSLAHSVFDGFRVSHIKGDAGDLIRVFLPEVFQGFPFRHILTCQYLIAMHGKLFAQGKAHASVRPGYKYLFHIVPLLHAWPSVHQRMAFLISFLNSGFSHTDKICPGARTQSLPFPTIRTYPPI